MCWNAWWLSEVGVYFMSRELTCYQWWLVQILLQPRHPSPHQLSLWLVISEKPSSEIFSFVLFPPVLASPFDCRKGALSWFDSGDLAVVWSGTCYLRVRSMAQGLRLLQEMCEVNIGWAQQAKKVTKCEENWCTADSVVLKVLHLKWIPKVLPFSFDTCYNIS